MKNSLKSGDVFEGNTLLINQNHSLDPHESDKILDFFAVGGPGSNPVPALVDPGVGGSNADPLTSGNANVDRVMSLNIGELVSNAGNLSAKAAMDQFSHR